jgi:drug/metabolite transporter (DMT)-like permease
MGMIINMPKSANGNRWGATDLWMLLTTMVWGVNLSMIKFSLRDFASPHGYNGIRLTIASVVFLGVLFFRRENLTLRMGDWWRVAGLGILGTTLYQLLFIRGINLTTASASSMIMPMTPVFIALLSFAFKLERIRRGAWIGIAVSFIGVYLVISGKNGWAAPTWQSAQGAVLLLLANLSWALYTVFSKPLLERISPVKLAVLTTSIGTLFYLPFAVPAIRNVSWASVSPGAWAAMLYSSILAIVVCFSVYYASVRKVGNTKTGIYSNLNPVFATIFAFFFLSERISAVEICGAIVIFIGVYLTRRDGAKPS